MRIKIYILALSIFALQNFSFAQFTKLADLQNTETGFTPYFVELCTDGTYLYGTARNGGANGDGTIYRIKPDGTEFAKIFDFSEDDATGIAPESGLYYDGTYLYGTTIVYGEGGYGTTFRIKPDGSEFEVLVAFDETNGSQPHGLFYDDGTYLYGVTTGGGLLGHGTIYKMKRDGSDFEIIFNFDLLGTGNGPTAGLISDGTYLYGMTVGGSSTDNYLGTLYKIKPDGSDHTILMDFLDDPNGAYPYGYLVFDGTYLYGMTNTGGDENRGTIFKIKTDGTEYQKLLDFDNDNGAQPLGSLILVGTTLYGMAELGGPDYQGTLFQIQTDGSDFTSLFDFDGENTGGLPFGTLMYSNGALFGVTSGGGAYNNGTIFRYGDLAESIEEPKPLEILISPNPTNGTFSIMPDDKHIHEICKIEIVNSQGEIILIDEIYSSEKPIELKNAAAGLYLVKLYCGNDVLTSQLVVN